MQNQFGHLKNSSCDNGNRRGSTGSASSQQSNASSSYTISCQSQKGGLHIKQSTRGAERPGLEKHVDRKCIVYLLDGHPIEFAYKNSLTVQELFDIVCSQLLLQEKEYFGLFTLDELRHKHWLDLKPKVTSCVLDTSKRHFEIHLGVKFFVLSVRRLRHFTTIELFYLQYRKLVFEGDLKAPGEILFELAATALQESYGDFQNPSSTEECLRQTPLLSVDAWSSEESLAVCIEKVVEYHMRLAGKSRGEAILHYISIVESLPMYGMHFYRVKSKAGRNPLWVSIGLMGLQEWTSKDHEYEAHEGRDDGTNDTRIPTSISQFGWSSITHIRQERKEFTIEVEQKDVDGCTGNDSSSVPKTPRAKDDESRQLFNTRTPILGSKGFGSWSNRKNKTTPGVFCWSGKSEVMKTMFRLACEHHKFYLQHMLATNEELGSGLTLTSPYQEKQWSPCLGPRNTDRVTTAGDCNAITIGADARKKGVPGPLRSLQDVSAAELSNSELSINSSSGFSDSGLATNGVPKTASYFNIQNNSHANNHRKESQSESCGGTTSCSTSQSFSMLSGTSDLGPSLETLQDLVAAFSAQRDSLLDKLRTKLEQLKELCLQESEITGKLPDEYPLSPGSSPPPPRRKVGTSFVLPDNVYKSLKRSKNSQHVQSGNITNLEEQRSMLQTDVDIKTQIIEAEKKLLSENKNSKRGKRKDKKQNILRMEAELRDMRLKLAQMNRDIEKQKLQAFNSSLEHCDLRNDDRADERDRAKSVSERYKNHVASTDALNAPLMNDFQEILSSRTESIIKSSPNSPALNRSSRIYNGGAWNIPSMNNDDNFFPEEHESTLLSSSQYDKHRGDVQAHANTRPYSPERRFTSDFSPSAGGGRLTDTDAEKNWGKVSEEDDVAGYVPSGAYHVTNYRATRYPTHSLKKLRHKSQEDLLGSSVSPRSNWRQPVKTSTASLNAQINTDRRESQLRTMTQMLSASSLGAPAYYPAYGDSNASCASSNISSSKEEHISSRSSYASLNRRYDLPYTSENFPSTQDNKNSHSSVQTTWLPHRSKSKASHINMGLTQSQSVQTFYGTVSPMKSTFDVNYEECDEVSLSSAEGNRSSQQSVASYDASSYYQRCVNRKSQQLDGSVAYRL